MKSKQSYFGDKKIKSYKDYSIDGYNFRLPTKLLKNVWPTDTETHLKSFPQDFNRRYNAKKSI